MMLRGIHAETSEFYTSLGEISVNTHVNNLFFELPFPRGFSEGNHDVLTRQGPYRALRAGFLFPSNDLQLWLNQTGRITKPAGEANFCGDPI
jgi:hypothetical protein